MTEQSDLPFRTVGFDLDGTLLDTAPDITNALNHALREAGRPALSFERVRPLIGGGAKRLLARALAGGGPDGENGRVDPELLEPLYAVLLDHYAAHIAVDTRKFEGMERALDRLAQMGVSLGVATNKLEHLARQLLTEMGLADRFACIVGGDTLGSERAKPKPDLLIELAQRCGGMPAAFVGDSSYDTRAAKAAGMAAIAVSFGYPGMPVDELGADAVIDHYDDLIPALARLGTPTV